VCELLVLDNRIRELLVARPSWDIILATARQNGMRTIRESAEALVIRGITSIEEVDRITT
jgi:general secretion pathway protein E